MTFKTEFPDFAAADMPAIPAGFEDISWSNDACPSFLNKEIRRVFYVDYLDPAQREYPESLRFGMYECDEEGARVNQGREVESDDWNAILAEIDRATLAAEYLKKIGYDPFEDDPEISVETVRSTLAEFDADAR